MDRPDGKAMGQGVRLLLGGLAGCLLAACGGGDPDPGPQLPPEQRIEAFTEGVRVNALATSSRVLAFGRERLPELGADQQNALQPLLDQLREARGALGDFSGPDLLQQNHRLQGLMDQVIEITGPLPGGG